MIGKLKGVIDSYGEDCIILDVNGVGYRVHCSARTLQELPATGLRLSQSALPSRDGYDFHLISVRDAQSEAERTRMTIYFITVDRPAITGDTATIWLGVDFVLPPDPNLVKSCCCVGEAHFRRVEHRWKFFKWGRGACA